MYCNQKLSWEFLNFFFINLYSYKTQLIQIYCFPLFMFICIYINIYLLEFIQAYIFFTTFFKYTFNFYSLYVILYRPSRSLRLVNDFRLQISQMFNSRIVMYSKYPLRIFRNKTQTESSRQKYQTNPLRYIRKIAMTGRGAP